MSKISSHAVNIIAKLTHLKEVNKYKGDIFSIEINTRWNYAHGKNVSRKKIKC
jgi:hypothetical protein